MRNVTWIRFGIAATIATVGAAGTLAVGCSDDDNVGTTPGVDAGPDTNIPKVDAGPDTAPSKDSSVPPVKDAGSNAKLILVHASPDVPAIRVCFGTGKLADGSDSVVQPLPALPDTAGPGLPYPGVFPGTGGAFPDITDLSATAILPFVVLADAIKTEFASDGGTEATCDQLVGTTKKACAGTKCLTADKYVQLPAIPAQTFLKDKTFLLAATGCLPNAKDPNGTPARCGATYGDGGTGNVGVEISELDTTFTPPDGGFGAQFVHRASAIEGFAYPVGGTVTVPFAANGLVPGTIGLVPAAPVDAGILDAGADADAGDAGPPPVTFVQHVFTTGPSTKFGNNPPTPAVVAVIQDPAESAFGVFVKADGGTPNPAPLSQGGDQLAALPLKVIQQLTTGTAGPFKVNETYTFVLLGDPAAAQLPNPDGGPGVNPAYDGHGIHIIAFPNHPVVKGL
jgi:hypothetical protein